MYEIERVKFNRYDFFLLLFFTFLFFVFRYKPINGDSLLAWPITESIALNKLYNSNDLIIKAGVEGNFMFYQILGYFPFFKHNYPLRDFIIYVPLFFCYITFWYFIFLEISQSKNIAKITLLFFLFSDNKLGINWSNAPMPFLASVSSIHFLQVLSLFLLIKQRYNISFLILSLTSYFHPGSSLSYFLIFSSIILYKFYKEKKLRLLIAPIIYILAFTPNFYLILSKYDSAFNLPANYFNIFNIFQYHAYISDHINDGYFYTFSLIFIVLKFLYHKDSFKYKNELLQIFIFSIVWCILWFINLYFFKNLSFIHTYLVTRVFYLLKPLIILLFFCFLSDIYQDFKTNLDKAFISAVGLTIIIFSPIYSSVIVLSFLIYLINRKIGLISFIFISTIYLLILWNMTGHNFSNLKLYILKLNPNFSFVFLESLLFVFVVLILKIYYRKYSLNVNNKLPQLMLVLFLLIFVSSDRTLMVFKNIKNNKKVLNLSWDNYFGISEYASDYAKLVSWAKEHPYNLFVVPPDEDIFLSFRYLTKNGLFVTEGDINQLMYSPKYYVQAFERLKLLGINIEGRHKTNYDNYYKVPIEDLKKTNANYIVYNKSKLMNLLPNIYKRAYENDTYLVFEIQ